MPETVLTPTNNAKFIPIVIAQTALGRLSSYLNLAKTVARDTDVVSATYGETIKVPKRGAITANAKTRGEKVTKQAPTATDVSVTLDQHFEVTLLIEDVTKVLQNQNTMQGYAEDAAIALAEKVELALANLYSSIPIGQVVSFNPSSAATMEDSFLEARQKLVDLKVPLMAPKFGYLHSGITRKLLQIDRFTKQDSIGANSAIQEGRLARVAGFDLFESQVVVGTGSPAQYHNLLYTRNAFVLATRPLPNDGNGEGVRQVVVTNPDVNVSLRVTYGYDKDQLGTQMTLDVLFGVGVMDDRAVVELRSS